VNSVILCFCLYVTLFMLDFYLFVSEGILNLVIKVTGHVDTHLVNTQNFGFEFFNIYN
jgi:hypothetical protein